MILNGLTALVLAAVVPSTLLVKDARHFDHSFGLRTCMALGATVVTHDQSRGFYRDVLLAGCLAEAPAPSNMGTAATAAAQQTGAASGAGLRTFVIVPAESRASYHASEEFFSGALKLLGIQAGKVLVVGATQAIEGRFRFDPERPDVGLGDSTFAVQVNTLTSNQQRRDDYMREIRDDGGPSFDRYPSATFRGTAIDVRTTGGDLKGQITGDMTIRDVTQRVAFDVTARLVGDTLTGSATSHLRLSDFGIGPIQFARVLTVADEFRVEIEFTAREERR